MDIDDFGDFLLSPSPKNQSGWFTANAVFRSRERRAQQNSTQDILSKLSSNS